MKPNRRTENHHFVPLFYLRQWCEADGRLWVYPTDTRKGFRSPPKSFAAEKGLYDTSDLPDMASIDEEGDLGDVEGLYASNWPGVFNGTTDARTKMNLSRFLALMHLRHPRRKDDVRDLYSEFRRIAELAEGREQIEIVGRSGERVTIKVSDIFKYAGDTAGSTKEGFLTGMHRSVEDLAQMLNARKWAVICADAPVFITSDTPFVIQRGSAAGRTFSFGTAGTVVTFPISPTKLLRMSEEYQTDGLHYPLVHLGALNDGTVLGADRFIFSRLEFEEPRDAPPDAPR